MTPLHPPILGTLTLRWPDEAACAACASTLARRAAPLLRNAIVELDGPLGAGKTTFARHLLRALGVQGPVKSPTYAVLEPYALEGMDVAHFDFYRFDDPQEWEDAGLREAYAAPGLKLVEWASQAAPLLPAPDLRLALDPGSGDAREVRVEAYTSTGMQLLEGLSP